jgi:tol-pal system protein YbgF
MWSLTGWFTVSFLRVSRAGFLSLGVLLPGVLCTTTAVHAQAGPGGDLLYRIERLENQLRQLTGEIEQLQYRNQQLEATINDMRYQEPAPRGGGRVAAAPGGVAAPMPPGGAGRRSDAFNPDENPYAPGAPRQLGSMQPQPPPPNARPGVGPAPYAAGGNDGYGRSADPGYGRPPAGAAGNNAAPPAAAYPAVAAVQPTTSAREVYDAGVSSLQRHDYAAAEESFRDFLRRFPSDRMAAEAQFNLGESLYQRQSYQEAANAFVQMSKQYESSAKAPDALLRLGQALAALNEKDLACVALADVGRKYPRARSDVKQAVERELKRARCS